MSSPSLKLYYFNLRARAEFIRLILAAAGRAWDDTRLDFTHITLFLNCPQWAEYKPKMLLGQVPVLEFADGTQLPQSFAIARYIGRETGLAGENDLESAKIDAVVDTQWDMNDLFLNRCIFEKNEDKKAQELEKFLDNDLTVHIEKLMKLKKAYSSNSSYFVGNNLSWADLYVYQSMDRVIRAAPQVKNKLDENFKEVFDAIENNPGIRKYLKERPDTPF
ncbi:unnamed protein product [Rotaria sp. Silwood2]|nr:unnamed protein product [Rotaria sp. Silwood2]CAF4325482.1 unnamed protein product [Rotaria sp. Silwood2]